MFLKLPLVPSEESFIQILDEIITNAWKGDEMDKILTGRMMF
jgi:hypothetical protein